jgi:3-phenylpropionate/trans-cinnamate dioxygenase ferredoxin reductase subunit
MKRREGTEMAIVKADLGQCQGYANCVVAADDVFDIGDDGVVVVLLRAQIPDSDLARVQTAARSCPVSALTVEGK